MDGWMFVDEAMWADCRATTSKRVNLVTTLEGWKGGGDKRDRIGSIAFLEQFPIWEKNQ